MGGGHRRQSAGDRSHRLIPRHSFEPSTALRPGAAQRRQQARLWVDHHPVIGGRALIAEPAATDGMVPVTPHVPDHPVAHGHLDAARVVAVAWTGREDGLLRRSDDTLYHATEAGSATRSRIQQRVPDVWRRGGVAWRPAVRPGRPGCRV